MRHCFQHNISAFCGRSAGKKDRSVDMPELTSKQTIALVVAAVASIVSPYSRYGCNMEYCKTKGIVAHIYVVLTQFIPECCGR